MFTVMSTIQSSVLSIETDTVKEKIKKNFWVWVGCVWASRKEKLIHMVKIDRMTSPQPGVGEANHH